MIPAYAIVALWPLAAIATNKNPCKACAMADSPTFAPHEAATMIGVTVHSIRRWCGWHSAYLSPGASPGTNAPRRLTARDIEVLQAVRDLRAQGLATLAINERLQGMAFADIAPMD